MKAKVNKVEKLEEYIPSIQEKYMNKNQLSYFKDMLEAWHLQAHRNLMEAEERLAELNMSDERDDMDRAFVETEITITINKIGMLQNLMQEIDVSLNDINEGTYGFCKRTGKEIGLKRLFAKPTSRFAITVQETEEKEQQKKSYNKLDVEDIPEEIIEEVE